MVKCVRDCLVRAMSSIVRVSRFEWFTKSRYRPMVGWVGGWMDCWYFYAWIGLLFDSNDSIFLSPWHSLCEPTIAVIPWEWTTEQTTFLIRLANQGGRRWSFLPQSRCRLITRCKFVRKIMSERKALLDWPAEATNSIVFLSILNWWPLILSLLCLQRCLDWRLVDTLSLSLNMPFMVSNQTSLPPALIS